MSEAVQLNSCAWFLEQRVMCEKTLICLREALGTYRCETDKTYSFMEGYLSGLVAMYRKMEDDQPDGVE